VLAGFCLVGGREGCFQKVVKGRWGRDGGKKKGRGEVPDVIDGGTDGRVFGSVGA